MHSKRSKPGNRAEAVRSDAQLAVAAGGGDKRAFVEIVARHQGMVAGVALAILRDFAASEDAAQEAFLTAWKKIGDLREADQTAPLVGEHRPEDRPHAPAQATPGGSDRSGPGVAGIEFRT